MSAVRVGERVRRTTPHRSDDGSILPLVAVFAALCLSLVLVVLAAGSLYIERKRLYTIADGAALAGAESFPLDRAPDAAGELPRLRADEVETAARAYLGAASPTSVDELELVAASTPDGRTAEVTVAGAWRPPVLTLVLPAGIRLEATSTARAVLR